MKKIILFIDNLSSGGAQRQMVNIAGMLKKEGYEVSALIYQDMPFYKSLLDKNDIPIVLVETKSYASRVFKICKYLNKAHADVVISFLEVPCFISCFSRMWNRKWKLITTELSAKMSTFSSKKNKLFNEFERFSNAKVGNSHNAMNMWRKYYPKFSDKYSVIYNPVVIPEKSLCEKHTYASDGIIKLCIAASYQELKNPLKIIEALNMLTDDQKAKIQIDWYGRVEVTYGNTEIYEKAVNMVKEYGLESYIRLNEETNEIYRIMAESDAVGLFSTVEGLPNTICEAMTIGRPVVMSKVSDYDLLVTDNGYLCDPYSVESIRESLVKLIETPAIELERMGKASKEKAKELFSAEAITRQWIETIEKIIL